MWLQPEIAITVQDRSLPAQPSFAMTLSCWTDAVRRAENHYLYTMANSPFSHHPKAAFLPSLYTSCSVAAELWSTLAMSF